MEEEGGGFFFAEKRDATQRKETELSPFRKANEGWKLIQTDNWFGATYQTTAPSTWGSLYLHTNINHAFFMNHILKSMEKTERLNTNKAKKKKYKIIGKQCLETEHTTWKYGTNERNHEVKVNNIEHTYLEQVKKYIYAS